MSNLIKDSGLTYDFRIVDGKFSFTSGAEKKRKDLLFFMGFDFITRIYRPEFRPEIYWVVQKPMAYVNNLKVLLIGNLRNKILTFIQNISVLSMDVGQIRTRKAYYLFLEYAYSPDAEPQEVNIEIKS